MLSVNGLKHFDPNIDATAANFDPHSFHQRLNGER